MSRRRKIRRIPVWRIAIALVLGAIVNVLVAWGIILRVEYPPERGIPSRLLESSPVHMGIDASLFPRDLRPGGSESHRYFMAGGGVGYQSLRVREWSDHSVELSRQYIGVRAGWPMAALRSDWEGMNATARIAEIRPSGLLERLGSGLPAAELPEWLRSMGVGGSTVNGTLGDRQHYYDEHDRFTARVIPLMPMPLGFTLNTLLYSLPFAAVLIIFPALLRRRGRRRGLCPNCKYDRAGLPADAPCPECEAVVA